MKISVLFAFAALVLFASCDKSPMVHDPYQLIINFKFDGEAERQNNIGNAVDVAEGHAAQTPDFRELGIHYLGIFPDKFTTYSGGEALLATPTTEQGGISAIDFDREFFIDETNNQIKINLSEVTPGIYEYLRSSLAFQRYNITFNLKGADLPDGIDDDIDVDGKIASFLGYNTYIDSYDIDGQVVIVNSNKAQGYFGLESSAMINGYAFNQLSEGNSPQTTVPNPINDTSPVPAGSCVVTGKFPTALVIPAEANKDIIVDVIISTNNSFEWVDGNGNGKYEPILGEQVIDMGTRGFFPSVRE